jgi:NAD dependent epimerase/dehydratase family enzyme
MDLKAQRIFLTGSTGYIGSRLIPILTARDHHVAALTREQSRHKLQPHCEAVPGSALEAIHMPPRLRAPIRSFT